jgi:hypothetical protein
MRLDAINIENEFLWMASAKTNVCMAVVGTSSAESSPASDLVICGCYCTWPLTRLPRDARNVVLIGLGMVGVWSLCG